MPSMRSCLRALRTIVELLNEVEVQVANDRSLIIRHWTGSFIRFRGDGNIDLYAKRNIHKMTERGVVLSNCKVLDYFNTREEIWAYHDRLHGTNLEGRDARGHSANPAEPDKQHWGHNVGDSPERWESDLQRQLDYRAGWGPTDPIPELASSTTTL